MTKFTDGLIKGLIEAIAICISKLILVVTFPITVIMMIIKVIKKYYTVKKAIAIIGCNIYLICLCWQVKDYHRKLDILFNLATKA